MNLKYYLYCSINRQPDLSNQPHILLRSSLPPYWFGAPFFTPHHHEGVQDTNLLAPHVVVEAEEETPVGRVEGGAGEAEPLTTPYG